MLGGECSREYRNNAPTCACAVAFLQHKRSRLYPHRAWGRTVNRRWLRSWRRQRAVGVEVPTPTRLLGDDEALLVDPWNGTNSSKQLNRWSTGEQQRTRVPAKKNMNKERSRLERTGGRRKRGGTTYLNRPRAALVWKFVPGRTGNGGDHKESEIQGESSVWKIRWRGNNLDTSESVAFSKIWKKNSVKTRKIRSKWSWVARRTEFFWLNYRPFFQKIRSFLKNYFGPLRRFE
jgi:hypothetical protein